MSVGIAQCKQYKMTTTSYLTAHFTVSLGGNTFLCFVQTTNSRTSGFGQSSHHLGFVANNMRPCCHARMSGESIWLHTPDCKAQGKRRKINCPVRFRSPQTSGSSLGGTILNTALQGRCGAKMVVPHGGRQRACQAYRRKRVASGRACSVRLSSVFILPLCQVSLL